MRTSEIRQWLEQNGGQKNREEKRVAVKILDPVTDKETTDYETHVILTANNGQVLEYIPGDPAEQTKGKTQAEVDAMTVDGQLDVVNREVARGDPSTDNRAPERREQDRSTNAEAVWQRVNGPNPSEEDKRHPAYDGEMRGSGIYETHEERRKREQTIQNEREADEDRARRGRTEERVAQTDAERLELERRRVEQAEAAETRRAGEAEADRLLRERQTGVSERQVGVQEAAEERAARGTTQVIGSPTYSDPKFSAYNPVTGEITQADNPNYDAVRVAAERERERVRLGIEAGKFTAEVGAQQYKEWYDKNVTVPLTLAAERRAAATERRQAQEAADRREQARRQNEVERARIGQQAAESAQANERAMLPYRAGPQFGEQFSSAVNSLAAGGRLDTNAAAGINFTADAFEFDAPNWSKVAKNATKEALKHLTPYDPDETPYAVADYTGIAMPDASTMAAAPASTGIAPELLQSINTAIQPYQP